LSSVAEPAALGPDGFVRKRWTVDDCRQMIDSGLLAPGSFELIEGEVISKMGQGRLHIAVVTRIMTALAIVFGAEVIQSQAPIGIGDTDEYNDPEPDAAVLRERVTAYVDREPDPAADVLLVVEAAVSSLPGDLGAKARIYGSHGVQEYWVVSGERRELIVFRGPGPLGYASMTVFGESESAAPMSSPESLVRVADLLA